MADVNQEKLKKLVGFKQDPTFASFQEIVNISKNLTTSNKTIQHANSMIRTMVEGLSAFGLIDPQVEITPIDEPVSTKEKLKKLVGFKQDPTFASFKELSDISENIIASNKTTQNTNDMIRIMVDSFSVSKLVGPQGEEGKMGPQGEVGLTGATGAQGPQGEIGLTGVSIAGKDGQDGKMGPVGPRGEMGLVGPAGLNGSSDTGLQIVEKINSLSTTKDIYKIDFSHIKNVPDKFGETTVHQTTHRGGQQIAIKDEGTQITARATSINFVGAGVTSTASNGDVTVTIPTIGTGTINEIAYWASANTIGSLPVATYPSLAELAFVKGVTSAIQTQLNAKTFATLFPWTEITASTKNLEINNGYIASRATLLVFTLPATSVVGSIIRVIGKGVGGWQIAQNASQQIIWNEGGVDGKDETTVGVGGSLASVDDNDAIEIICLTADLLWGVLSSKGNISLT